jgi:hypothetical protein
MKLVTLFVVLCSTLAISNGQIIWDKLTAEELSALAPSSFRQIKPLELASIPDSVRTNVQTNALAAFCHFPFVASDLTFCKLGLFWVQK